MDFKPRKLKNLFYRNFILFIVIPILLIIIIALSVIKEMVLQSAIDKMQLAQNNIVSILNNEMSDTALKLSHFLQTNDNQILELANSYNLGNPNEKYEYSKKINTLLAMMMIPKNDVVAIHFYMKDGNTLCLKDDLAMPLQALRKKKWYQLALKNQGSVFIGGMINDVTYGKGYLEDKDIVFTFKPNKQDGFEEIELVCLYLNSSIQSMIDKYAKQPELGDVYLIDERGNLLIGGSNGAIPREILIAKEGGYKIRIGMQSIYYNVSNIKVGGWKIINAVNTEVLLTEFNQIAYVIMMTAIGLFSLFIIFSNTFLKNIINPINRLMTSMKQVRLGNLDIEVEVGGQEELKELGHSFNSMIKQIKELIAYNEQQQKEKLEIEIKALQSQINPHFLFNTLNAIKFMAMVAKFDSIKNMAAALMKIMSCTFKGANSFYSLEEEIEVLKSYSYIMQIRYSDSFKVQFEIEPSLLKSQIPRLLIQPILENAITHGFEEMEGIGKISIHGKCVGENIELIVEDNGKGMSPETIARVLSSSKEKSPFKQGIGISNVHKRIQLTYGLDYGVKVESRKDQYTKISISIPNITSKREGIDHV